MPDPPNIPSAPSIRCRGGATEGPPHLQRCNFTERVDYTTPFFGRTAPRDPSVPGGLDYARTGATAGWGPGMFLSNYLLDWGDCVARIIGKNCFPTILKAFPPYQDRGLALQLSHRFRWVDDHDDPPFPTHLVNAPGFVGYTWDATLLRKWIEQVTGKADALGAPRSLDADAAERAALDWIDFAAQLWHLYSRESFPYTIDELVRYWIKPLAPAPLP